MTKDYKIWSWWNRLTEREQEIILKRVYTMQEINIW